MRKTDQTVDLSVLGNTFSIRVTPKASSNRVVAEQAPDGTITLRIYVTTVAEDGKANDAALRLLSDYLDVPVSALTIARGAQSRNKIITLRNRT